MTDAALKTRYPRPKILLMDLPGEATDRLRAAGFNAHSGTFGPLYRVPMEDGFVPVVAQARIPGFTEQEVVIIDLTEPDICDNSNAATGLPKGVPLWYAKANWGWIDFRPITMVEVCNDWDRILESGGAFVVFAQPRSPQQFRRGIVRHGRFESVQDFRYDNWSFLPILWERNIEIEASHGTESRLLKCPDFLEKFLQDLQPGLEFMALLKPLYFLTEQSEFTYFPLMENKYGQVISGIMLSKKPKGGLILILPQIEDKVRAVSELITTVLPELRPELFPQIEGGRWVLRDEYEHVSLLELKANQRRVREEAEARITALDKEIEAERERLGFLHGILTKSGEGLVDDLRETLRLFGFLKVETPEEEAEPNKQEDLQILDRTPRLLLEVKGLAGLPTEADTHQCTKYVLRRMNQWDRMAVTGVFVVNHQRNLAALDRKQIGIFTPQQLEDAVGNGMGLTTTWDLFRLARGMLRWGWPLKSVQDVFYCKGRLPSVPSNYAAAGTVSHFYSDKSVMIIDVSGAGLRVGDVVGFLLPAGFFEEHVTSLQINEESVAEAQPGQSTGHKTTLKRREVPVGTAIYVNTTAHDACAMDEE